MTTPTEIAPLFTPLRTRALELDNRFVMAPMTRSKSRAGVPGENVAAYYARRASGGVGLIITEGVGIDHPSALGYSGVDLPEVPRMFGDKPIEGWRTVVDRVHAVGGKIAPQLWHHGPMRVAGTGPSPDAPSMRPSGLWGPLDGKRTVGHRYLEQVSEPTRAMTDDEIFAVIHSYGDAARTARELGFDAVAIHGAHGYLIDAFFWDRTNTRTDRWGGSPSQRSAFASEVVAAVRAAAPDLPMIFRFSQWKQQDYDARIAASADELAQVLGPLADAGVDIFDASTRHFDEPAFAGSELSLAGWAKKVTGKLTMAVGSVGLSGGLYDDPHGAATAHDNLGEVARRFESEEFDLVGVGRMLIAQPDWVDRVRSGRMVGRFDRSQLSTLN